MPVPQVGQKYRVTGFSKSLRGKSLRLTFGETETCKREYRNRVGMAAGDVLAFAAMTLQRSLNFALGIDTGYRHNSIHQ